MTTRELIEAVRVADYIPPTRPDELTKVPAEDYDRLIAATVAVLDEVIDKCGACGGHGRVPYYRIDGNEGGTMDEADCDDCANVRELREKLR